MFETENSFYEANKKDFQKKYLNKKLLIVGNKLIGVYDNDEIAIKEALKNYKPNTFVIKNVSDNDDTVQRFYSRLW